jgi:hypothetical protein
VEAILTSPYFMGFFGATMGFGLLVLAVTYFLFKFLRKRIAEDIIGMPAPGGPDDTRSFFPPAKCPWPCQEHKAMVERLGAFNSELDIVEVRQKKLREEDLPEKYVLRRDYDSCKKDRQSHETELFTRVGALERAKGGS